VGYPILQSDGLMPSRNAMWEMQTPFFAAGAVLPGGAVIPTVAFCEDAAFLIFFSSVTTCALSFFKSWSSTAYAALSFLSLRLDRPKIVDAPVTLTLCESVADGRFRQTYR